MYQHLYFQSGFNSNDRILGSYKHGGTSYLTIGNLIGRIINSNYDLKGLGIWTWKKFRGQGSSTLQTVTCCWPVSTTTGGVQ